MVYVKNQKPTRKKCPTCKTPMELKFERFLCCGECGRMEDLKGKRLC